MNLKKIRDLRTDTMEAYQLEKYCVTHDFMGWDPYDGLESRLFKCTPFNQSAFCRLAWIQLFKRNPWNLRKAVGIGKGHNAKGLGLFLSGYSLLALHRKAGGRALADVDLIDFKIHKLAELLIDMAVPDKSGACWGYNFAWQARGGLYFPKNTPTVVATTYAACGLFDAYEATGKAEYLDVALSSANFVLHDLKRDYDELGNFLFSYSPVNGNNSVYNASMLGSKLLARCYHYTQRMEYMEEAEKSVSTVIQAQESDGSWVYGKLPIQNWKDSFHTGFVLECLKDYMKWTGDDRFVEQLEIGTQFYLDNFFTEQGVPKYYDQGVYPIDIHSPAQLIVTLNSLGLWPEKYELAQRVLKWTIENMYDEKGFFYYQKKASITTKIPYMRWSQAWMLRSLFVYHIAKEDHGFLSD